MHDSYELSYYKNTDLTPKIAKKALLESLLFLGSKIFFNDSQESFRKRIFIVDFESSTEYTIQRSTEYLTSLKKMLPIMAYNIQESSLNEEDSALINKAQVHGYFSNVLCRYIYSYPDLLTIRVGLFFNTPDDYFSCMQILSVLKYSIFRIYPEFTFGFLSSQYFDNKYILYKTCLPVTLYIPDNPEKGNFSFNFREALTKLQIYDLFFSLKIKFFNYLIDNLIFFDGPIENVLLNLHNEGKEVVLKYNPSNIPFSITSIERVDNKLLIYFTKSVNIHSFFFILDDVDFEGIMNWNTNYTVFTMEGTFKNINSSSKLIISKNTKSFNIFGEENLDKDYYYYINK